MSGTISSLKINGVELLHSSVTVTGLSIPAVPPPAVSLLFRDPRFNDDSTLGYAVGSYWLNRASRSLFKATQVSAGNALWAVQPSYVGTICDQITTAPAAAYGAIQLVAAYAGKCCRIQRASDSTQTDIGFVEGQFNQMVLDAASAASFIGASTGTVVKWYDQSGNGLDATNGAHSPKFTTNTVNGYQGITFDSSQTLGLSFTIPAGLSVDRANYSTFILLQVTAPAQGTTALIGVGSDATFSNNQFAGVFNTGKLQYVPGVVFGTSFDATPVAAGYTSGAGGTTEFVNEATNTGATQSSITMTGGKIGIDLNGNGYVLFGEYLAAVIYGTQLSAANMTTLKLAGYANIGITPQVMDRIILLGDSITAGASSDPDRPYWAQSFPSWTRAYQVYNKGASGQTAAFHNTNYAASVAPLYRSTNRNVMFVFIGTNDIETGSDAATVYNAIVTLCQAGRATGFKVIVATILPRGSGLITQAAFLAIQSVVNANILSNFATFADGLCDFGGHPIMGNPANLTDATLYSGELHPTALGASYLAAMMTGAVNALG